MIEVILCLQCRRTIETLKEYVISQRTQNRSPIGRGFTAILLKSLLYWRIKATFNSHLLTIMQKLKL